MIKPADLPKDLLTTADGLWSRVEYQVDPNDPGHFGKILHPPGNYNCAGDSAVDFVGAVLENARRYGEARKGKVGKRTPLLYQERIYSGPEGRLLAPAEKRITELVFVALLHGVPARVAWHDDPKTRRSDAHILFGYHIDGAAMIGRYYGTGKESFDHACYRTEKALVEELNRRNPEAKKIMTTAAVAAERRAGSNRERQTPADIFVALLGDTWDGDEDKLRRAADEKKIKVTRQNDDYISVILPGRRRAVRLFLGELAQAKDRAKMRQLQAAKTAAKGKQQIDREAADDL